MADKAYVQTAAGAVIEIPKSEERAHIESGDFLPATAADLAEQEKRAKNNTTGAKLATAVESVGAGAIDAVAAPFTASARAAAALGHKYIEKKPAGLNNDFEDPVAGLTGRNLLSKAAGPINSAFSDKSSGQESADFAEGQRERAEAHPAIAMGGNIAGAIVGGGGLARGAGALGAGATEALGGGMLARAAGAVTTGAAEGAAYGQASAADEAYIQNIPLTAEKVVASMGWGALMGGGVSLAAHAASGALGMIRSGSRGATPLDSPRLPASPADAAEGDIAAAGDEATSGVRPVAAEAAPQYEVNVGAFDKESMRPESADFVRDNPEAANAKGPPRIEVYPDSGPQVIDGRHRMQAAADRGESTIDAQVVHYDAEGNKLSEVTQPVSLSDTPHGNPREAVSEVHQPAAADIPLPGPGGAANDTAAAPHWASGKLREFADERTAKALGANVSSIKALGRTAEQAKTQMHAMSQAVQDATLEDGSKVFRPLDSPDVLAERVAKAHEETTAKLADFREQAAKVFDEHPEIAPKPEAIADRIQSEVLNPLLQHPSADIRATARAR